MRPVVVSALVRALPWPIAGGLLWLGVMPTALTLARGGHDFAGAAVAAGLIVPPAIAYAFDEPARVVLDATPIPPPHRSALRSVPLLVNVAAILTAVAVVMITADPAGYGPIRARVAEATATGALSLAAAAAAHRSGAAEVSIGAVAVGPLTVLLVSALSARWPWLPSVGRAQHATRWWLLTGPAVALTAWAGRDPYHRLRMGPRSRTARRGNDDGPHGARHDQRQ
jgi:hypothetical protein